MFELNTRADRDAVSRCVGTSAAIAANLHPDLPGVPRLRRKDIGTEALGRHGTAPALVRSLEPESQPLQHFPDVEGVVHTDLDSLAVGRRHRRESLPVDLGELGVPANVVEERALVRCLGDDREGLHGAGQGDIEEPPLSLLDGLQVVPEPKIRKKCQVGCTNG